MHPVGVVSSCASGVAAAALVPACCLPAGDGLCAWVSMYHGGLPCPGDEEPPALRVISKYQPAVLERPTPHGGSGKTGGVFIYNIYIYDTSTLAHFKFREGVAKRDPLHRRFDGPVAYRLSPTQRQNNLELLQIRAHDSQLLAKMTADRRQWKWSIRLPQKCIALVPAAPGLPA